jgi:transcriptional regulator with XRE-family HTH domain
MPPRSNTCTGTVRSLAAVREGDVMDAMKTVAQLCAEQGIDARQLAERARVDEQRVTAIILGRWTPSPEERDRIAAALGATRDQIAWGHKTPVQHLYGQGPA